MAIKERRKAVLKMQTVKGKTSVTVNGDDGWIEFPTIHEAKVFVQLLADLIDIGMKRMRRVDPLLKSLIPDIPIPKRVIFTDSGEEVIA